MLLWDGNVCVWWQFKLNGQRWAEQTLFFTCANTTISCRTMLKVSGVEYSSNLVDSKQHFKIIGNYES